MLPKQHRLRKDSDFTHLFKKGRSVGNRSLVLKYVKTEENQPTRLAFVMSKKSEKSAVKRNRARRQAREIIRKNIEHLKEGYDGSFVMKSGFLTLPKEDQVKNIFFLLKKAGLWK